MGVHDFKNDFKYGDIQKMVLNGRQTKNQFKKGWYEYAKVIAHQ